MAREVRRGHRLPSASVSILSTSRCLRHAKASLAVAAARLVAAPTKASAGWRCVSSSWSRPRGRRSRCERSSIACAGATRRQRCRRRPTTLGRSSSPCSRSTRSRRPSGCTRPLPRSLETPSSRAPASRAARCTSHSRWSCSRSSGCSRRAAPLRRCPTSSARRSIQHARCLTTPRSSRISWDTPWRTRGSSGCTSPRCSRRSTALSRARCSCCRAQ